MGYLRQLAFEVKNKEFGWKKAALLAGSVALVVTGTGGVIGGAAVIGGWWAYFEYKGYKHERELLNKIMKEESTKVKKKTGQERDIKREKERVMSKVLQGAKRSAVPSINDVNKAQGNKVKNQQASMSEIIAKLKEGRYPK